MEKFADLPDVHKALIVCDYANKLKKRNGKWMGQLRPYDLALMDEKLKKIKQVWKVKTHSAFCSVLTSNYYEVVLNVCKRDRWVSIALYGLCRSCFKLDGCGSYCKSLYSKSENTRVISK